MTPSTNQDVGTHETQICQGAGLSHLQNGEKQMFVVYEPLSSWYFCRRSPSGLRQYESNVFLCISKGLTVQAER